MQNDFQSLNDIKLSFFCTNKAKNFLFDEIKLRFLLITLFDILFDNNCGDLSNNLNVNSLEKHSR